MMLVGWLLAKQKYRPSSIDERVYLNAALHTYPSHSTLALEVVRSINSILKRSLTIRKSRPFNSLAICIGVKWF